eukprot:TRINITY_DN6386_c1_g1_i3.p1 TRINITY_DN6386_c1_g1~~TRINITY_DN6386_c1_g1_i3.p1  ORF type:complete len:497 (-),score=89.67 TRINITY_DN6386_c1_g1_i3:153-1643(-)
MLARVVPGEDESSVKPKPKYHSVAKLPGCAYHLAFVRASNFTKIAVIAMIVASGFAITKYFLSREGEDENIRNHLKATAKTVANTVKAKIESDLKALEAVGNLWRLDSKLDVPTYRLYVTSPLFKDNLQTMTTVMLLHNAKDQNRDKYELHPSFLALKHDCCKGTKYDLSFELKDKCRIRAKHQCGLSADRYHFVANEAATKKKIRAPKSDTYMVIMAQEPFENNPAPMGFDMRTFASRKVAWERAAATGEIAFTKRAIRTFAVPPEFGIVTWLPLFVDAVDSNKTLFDGVNLLSKQELELQGKTPYPIASVSGVYVVSKILENSLRKVFGDELRHTTIYLFDDRDDVESSESLLSIYADSVSGNNNLMDNSNLSPSTIMARTPGSQANSIKIEGTEMSVNIVIEPDELFLQSNRSNAPTWILLVSLLLVFGSQIERWLGKPSVVSTAHLRRTKAEAEVRAALEPQIKRQVDEAEQREAERDAGVMTAWAAPSTEP